MILIPVLAALVLSPAQTKLVVKDLVTGKGPAAKAGDFLTVEYKGVLAKDGKQFDSSVGEAPFSFTLGTKYVIEGWDKGLVGMKVGGKRLLTIPAKMAYGARERPGIPPNSALRFEVKLLHMRKKGAPVKIEIKELRPGKGPAAKAGDAVKVHYKGMYANNIKFDSSYDSGQPIDVTLGAPGFIKGFDQGLTGMKVGQKRRVTIPPELGYGVDGRPPIPGNSVLVFELELVKMGK
jgi:FKBP-type peptidyl-prolyl cis-trans isomerase